LENIDAVAFNKILHNLFQQCNYIINNDNNYKKQ